MPGLVEVNLEAREAYWEFPPGQSIPGFTFNGEVPGRTIEANRGDTIVVRLANNPPQPTMGAWHGVRFPARVGGPGGRPEAVPPGGTFESRFEVADAGTHWYPSHSTETEPVER